MTVASGIANGFGQLEFVLCIEGIGWPTNELDVSSGFNGDVFTTGDLNSQLATTLGCAIHKGMSLPGTLSEKIDPISMVHSIGGLQAQITDDDWLLANFTPHKTGDEDSLAAAMTYASTTLQMTSGSAFLEGETCWISGSELVLLGPKVGSTFSSCTRGYLGTTRGPPAHHFVDTTGMSWEVGDSIYSVNRYYYGRRCRLYAHVPGEAVANMVLLFSGSLSSVEVEGSAGVWTFEFSSTNIFDKETESFKYWHIDNDVTIANYGTYTLTSGSGEGDASSDIATIYAGNQEGSGWSYRRNVQINYQPKNEPELSGGFPHQVGLKAFYNYRSIPGGTKGMMAALPTAPQARSIGSDDYTIGGYIRSSGGGIIGASKMASNNFILGDNARYEYMECQITAADIGEWNFQSQAGQSAKFLLDNISNDYRINRFARNRVISKNPIDVALAFLTSMPDEFAIYDADAGCDAENIIVKLTAPANDQWNGYWLFCVSGDNQDYCREIVDTVNASSTLTFNWPWIYVPAEDDEFQVRNSQYDTLPFGWGLGIHHTKIDIAEFERIRNGLFITSQVGPFLWGHADKLKTLETIKEQLLAPYGIFLVIDKTTGKLTPRYIGENLGDGNLYDYAAITDDEIVEWGNLNYQTQKPLGKINLKVRGQVKAAVHQVTTNDIYWKNGSQWRGGKIELALLDSASMNALAGDDKYDTVVYSTQEIRNAYRQSDIASQDVIATFHTVDHLHDLAEACHRKINTYATPPPVISLRVNLTQMLGLSAGSLISVSMGQFPVNPYTGDRGMTSQECVVLDSKISFERGTIDITAQMLPTRNFGLIAPAANTSAYDTDATSDYIVCDDFLSTSSYAAKKFWQYFQVGQLIEIRDATGALKEGPFTISGFGIANESDPMLVSDGVVRVAESITAVYAGEDYITFVPWSATTDDIASMLPYSAYGDANGDLTGGQDSKVFL